MDTDIQRKAARTMTSANTCHRRSTSHRGKVPQGQGLTTPVCHQCRGHSRCTVNGRYVNGQISVRRHAHSIFRCDETEKLRASEREDGRGRVIPFGLQRRTEARSTEQLGEGDAVLRRRLEGCRPGPSPRRARSPLRAESRRPSGRTASWRKGAQSGGRSAGDAAPTGPPSGEGADDESGSRRRGFRTAPPRRCVDGCCEFLRMATEGSGAFPTQP